MKGLILKDFINLKKNVKLFGVFTILYAIMAVTMMDTSFFSISLMVIVSILTLNLYSYDELANWDPFALTMPITKDNMVQAKYLMMLLLTSIGIVYSSIFTVSINIYKKTDTLFSGFGSIGAGAAMIILFYCVTIPFITKLGVEKARFILFSLFIIPFVIVVLLNNMIGKGELVISENLMQLVKFFLKYVYIFVPLIVIIILGVSYRISVGIYRKKEL